MADPSMLEIAYVRRPGRLELGRALQTMVRREAAWEFRLRLTDRCKIEMLLVGPMPNLSEVAVIDLDLVMDLVDGQGWATVSTRRGAAAERDGTFSIHILRNHLAPAFAQNQC